MCEVSSNGFDGLLDLCRRRRGELLAIDTDNLLVAGRCASMTHMGQSAARVSGGCFVMGQAAGTAAALAIQANVRPRDLSVKALQARLEADGAYLGRDKS